MAKYSYPAEVTSANLEELVLRAKKIDNRLQNLDVLALVLTILFGSLLLALIVMITKPYWVFTPNVQSISLILVISGGFTFFIILLLDQVRLLVRRLSYVYSGFPTSEECVFAEALLVVNRIKKNKKYSKTWHSRMQGATWKARYSFCPELLLYTKDVFNVRRREYIPEFRLLAGGTNQISRLLIFSESTTFNLLSKFSIAFVNNNDFFSHRYLTEIIHETEKYGSLENWFKKFQNEITSPYGIVTLVAALFTLSGAIIALIAAILGLL